MKPAEQLAAAVSSLLLNQPRAQQPARVITIYARGPNDFDVQEGERICDRLCWDEMLGQVASLTHPDITRARYHMLTPEERTEREERRAASVAAYRNDASF